MARREGAKQSRRLIVFLSLAMTGCAEFHAVRREVYLTPKEKADRRAKLAEEYRLAAEKDRAELQASIDQMLERAGAANAELSFVVPERDAADAWGRAQSFVGRFASVKVQVATDYILQTYNPDFERSQYGYYIVRTPVEGGSRFEVRPLPENIRAQANGKIAAHYIRTGELKCEDCITR